MDLLFLPVFHDMLGCFASVRLLPEPSLECLVRTARFHFAFGMGKFMENREHVPIATECQGQGSAWSQLLLAQGWV